MALAIRSHGVLIGLCTGTVVAPNLVLTARHCVADTDDSALCTANGTALSGAVVHADRSPSDLDVYRGAAAIPTIYEDYDRKSAAATGKTLVVEGSTLCNADLAFLVVDHTLPGPYAPIRTTATAVGASLTAVGYGLTETGDTPALRQQRGSISVRAIGKISYSGGAGLGDAELLVGESASSGDSGGPLLSTSGALVGVTSRGGGG
ncbi:MAG TPA: trypsin-like serine protease, partial [Labilithrix sp.]|nr:trypsin-like serine protease [Labilithrix sp.]